MSDIHEFELIKKLHSEQSIIDESSLDIVNRRVYFVGEVDQPVVESTVQHIHFLSNPLYFREDATKPITIIVNSPGGYHDFMWYMYDCIINSECEIHTVGSGMVASAATLILAAGDKRFATQNCWAMTHKGKASFSGDDDEVVAQTDQGILSSNRYWKLLERHTGRKATTWHRKSKEEGEFWMDAKKMLQWGLIDGIIEPPRRKFKPVTNELIASMQRKAKEDFDEDDE